jgi:hypothetical protein
MALRFGSALVLLALILLVIFLLTASIGQGDPLVLALGAALAALGLLIRKRGRRGGVQAARFRTLRRLLGRLPEEEVEE